MRASKRRVAGSGPASIEPHMDRADPGCGAGAGPAASLCNRLCAARPERGSAQTSMTAISTRQVDPGLCALDVIGDAEACHGRPAAVLAVEAKASREPTPAIHRSAAKNPGFDDDMSAVVAKH